MQPGGIIDQDLLQQRGVAVDVAVKQLDFLGVDQISRQFQP